MMDTQFHCHYEVPKQSRIQLKYEYHCNRKANVKTMYRLKLHKKLESNKHFPTYT
jgi:hypothetical protein